MNKTVGCMMTRLLPCVILGLAWSVMAPPPAFSRKLVAPPAGMRAPRTVSLRPCKDPFPKAAPRLRDIANLPYTTLLDGGAFDYAGATVKLTYDAAPRTPYFAGHLVASGLKPNFAYQLKLAGKPVDGSRGWGTGGDDVANQRIGYAGRWWCDSEQINVNDVHYERLYHYAPRRARHSVYGYLFMGDVVTDENGRANLTFDGGHCYHITWGDRQGGHKDVVAGIWTVQSLAAPYYAYGSRVPPRRVRLWYEWESRRPHRVRLPRGTYNCRFVLEEESFHNLIDGDEPGGGYWMAVLASEDYGAPADPSSAIKWTVGS